MVPRLAVPGLIIDGCRVIRQGLGPDEAIVIDGRREGGARVGLNAGTL